MGINSNYAAKGFVPIKFFEFDSNFLHAFNNDNDMNNNNTNHDVIVMKQRPALWRIHQADITSLKSVKFAGNNYLVSGDHEGLLVKWKLDRNFK